MKRIKKVAIVSIFLIILSTFAFGTPPEKLDLSIGIGYNAQTFRNVSAHGTVFNFYIADTWENNGVFLGDMSINIPLQLSIGRTFIGMDSQFRLGAEIVMGGGYEFLIGLVKSIRSQQELLEILIDKLLHEDRYLSLEEVKERIPGITTSRLNALARAGRLKARQISSRKHEYLESSLAELFPRFFRPERADED